MAELILLEDTFTQWLEKINGISDELNQIVLDIDSNVGFNYDILGSSGLTARFLAGRVRDGSVVETINSSILALPPSATSVVCIYKEPDVAPDLRVYLTSEVPARYVIPLWGFTTNATSTITYTDLRTQFSTSGGSVGTVPGILVFDKLIDRDVTVLTSQNALSIAPIVPEGTTVTVEEGAEWLVL